ncbi:MAG: methyltransferase family protein [Parvularculaceae bacterium]
MNEPEDKRPNVPVYPQTMFLTALVLGYILRILTDGYLPLPRAAAEGVGGVLILASVSLLLASARIYFANGEALNPDTPSDRLFTDGPYGYSRNPIYLAFMLFGAGFAIATQNAWILATTAAAGAAIHYFAILPEEGYLSHRFGEEYEAYRKRVRRWI